MTNILTNVPAQFCPQCGYTVEFALLVVEGEGTFVVRE